MKQPKTTPSRRKRIRADQLNIDSRYQRPLRAWHVRRLVEKFDFDQLGIFEVSEREDGTYWLMDGQHRQAAILQHGFGEWTVDCLVYTGLTIADEARIFEMRNSTAMPTAWDRYNAGLVAGYEECQLIDRIVRRTGWRMGNQQEDGAVRCVAAVQKIIRTNGKVKGPLALQRALEDAKAAWGDAATAAERIPLLAIAQLYFDYGDQVDRAALVRKLAKMKGGPAGLIAAARQLADIRSTSMPKAAVEIVLDHYNRGRKQEHRLGVAA